MYNDIAFEIIDYLSKTVPDDHHWGISNEEHWNDFRDYIRCGEAEITIEIICTNITDDLELTLPKEIYDKIVEVCNFFNVSQEYWQNIKFE